MNVAPTKPTRLFLLRHARAGWALPGETDFDRGLDKTGAQEASRIGNLLSANYDVPALILCSTAKRCRQTADLVVAGLSGQPEIRFVDRFYSGQVPDYMDEIHRNSDRGTILVIGHNPMIEGVLSACIGEDLCRKTIPEGYPTAGLAVVDLAADGNSDHAVLDAMLVP